MQIKNTHLEVVVESGCEKDMGHVEDVHLPMVVVFKLRWPKQPINQKKLCYAVTTNKSSHGSVLFMAFFGLQFSMVDTLVKFPLVCPLPPLEVLLKAQS